jgi:DNA-binding transcriptional ArsR family regulator
MNPFQIMCEPIRRRIIEILASGEHPAGHIVDSITMEFSVKRSSVFWHLAILRDNGWVDIREDYTSRLYRLEPDAIEMLTSAVERIAAIWERRIGVMAHTDPQPEHVLPIDGPPRLKPGVAKGWRARRARQDLWAPKPRSPRHAKKQSATD